MPGKESNQFEVASKMEEVKLIGHWASPFSCRVEVALKLKGIEYEFILEDLSNKSPLLLKCNPVYKKIPVLLHNGNPITESAVILQYIDETWKGNCQIFPEDPYEKAVARFWAKFVEEKLMPALWTTFMVVGEGEEKVKEEARELLKVFENELGDKRFFGGESIGFVDIVANFIAFWFRAIQEGMGMEVLSQEKFPKLWKWAEEFVNCDIVEETLPSKEELLANFPPPYMGDQLAAVFKSRFESASAQK